MKMKEKMTMLWKKYIFFERTAKHSQISWETLCHHCVSGLAQSPMKCTCLMHVTKEASRGHPTQISEPPVDFFQYGGAAAPLFWGLPTWLSSYRKLLFPLIISSVIMFFFSLATVGGHRWWQECRVTSICHSPTRPYSLMDDPVSPNTFTTLFIYISFLFELYLKLNRN